MVFVNNLFNYLIFICDFLGDKRKVSVIVRGFLVFFWFFLFGFMLILKYKNIFSIIVM